MINVDTAIRPRDATNTRQLLLEAARLRFARNGYSSTTVREIAGDAGVNVALINRYFTSKEGLFEACLSRAVDELSSNETGEITVDRIVRSTARQIAGAPSGLHSLHLLLLLRSSGDERADQIRHDTLQTFAEGMATAGGWRKDDPTTDNIMLRAQMALSMSLGIVLLRSSGGLQPLTDATEDDLRAPMSDAFTALLTV